ncbi:MAG: (deoxy)nucleoside triphosphate pyrophosphohydrolase [Desulforhabdus sp.]|nr:(deoxy)nucleoside triphosphate pyrophosphohydrolase [Desulforhabdus sp.]
MDIPYTSAAHLRVTAALISNRGRLFIAQRPPEKKFGLQWEFPGGKVEPGEGLKDSLIREIKEELCWEISVGDLFCRLRHSYPDFSIELYAYWCAIKEGRLCLNEHIAYRWVCPAELRRFDFTTADRQLVHHLEALSRLPLK